MKKYTLSVDIIYQLSLVHALDGLGFRHISIDIRLISITHDKMSDNLKNVFYNGLKNDKENV